MTLSKAAQELEKEFAEYEERKNQRQAPGWSPEVGSTIKVECIGLRMGVSEYGTYPIVVYKNLADGSALSVHAFHTILRKKLAELKTDIGSVQFLSYLGQQASHTRKDKDGESVQYHNYDVENVGEAITVREEGFTF